MTLLEEAIPAKDLKVEFKKMNALIVGPSGSGKSNLAATFPGKVLVIDLDQRSDSLAGRENVEILSFVEADPKSPKSWLAMEQVKKEIWSQARRGTLPYDLILESSLTTMNRAAMNWSMTLNSARGFGGGPIEAHYGPHGTAIAQHLMSMAGLPCSYILEAHFNIIEDSKEGVFKYIPKVWGKMLRTEVPTFFSEVWFMEKRPKGGGKVDFELYANFAPHFGSCRSALNARGKFWDDPQVINLEEKPCGIAKLIERRFGNESVHRRDSQDTPRTLGTGGDKENGKLHTSSK